MLSKPDDEIAHDFHSEALDGLQLASRSGAFCSLGILERLIEGVSIRRRFLEPP